MTNLPSISNLLVSPPEAKQAGIFSVTPGNSPSQSLRRAFSSEATMAPMPTSPISGNTTRVLPSPPISPWMDKRHKQEKGSYNIGVNADARKAGLTDPVLYSDSERGSTPEAPLFQPEAPLFQQTSHDAVRNTEELITKHMTMHMTQFKGKLSRPTREEYRLALACVSTIGALYNRSPGAYMKRQREESDNEYWQAKRLCARPGTKAVPIPIAPAPKTNKRAIKPATPKPNIPRLKRAPKISPLAKLMNYPSKGRSETPDRLSGVKREDVDYNALLDYAPPTSTLAGNPKTLRADWPSNNVLDLSNDLDGHMLHEAEISVAATLRLTCATYLCSKRRIFEARLNALRIGKEFRKTDAQQACKIDVNKASKLWTAFDKVGWFNKSFFQQHL